MCGGDVLPLPVRGFAPEDAGALGAEAGYPEGLGGERQVVLEGCFGGVGGDRYDAVLGRERGGASGHMGSERFYGEGSF